ncbi:MAG: hypothetical protein ACOX0E_01785 [Syntrophomonadaceae bacterium]
MHYHPAANRRLDELSQGKSSIIQLESLIANIDVAQEIGQLSRGDHSTGL